MAREVRIKRYRCDNDLAELIKELSLLMGETETRIANWLWRLMLDPDTVPRDIRERMEKALDYVQVVVLGKPEKHRAAA